VDQTSKAIKSHNGGRVGWAIGQRERIAAPGSALTEGLVRPGIMVMLDELLERRLKMAAAEDQQVIE
jgi:hypothetical protein